MAILHRKEEKIQIVLGRLPKNYTEDQFVEMFIKLHSKDWGKIKSAYIKKTQDKEAGTVVTMPKPDLYLKQVLATYLATAAQAQPEVKTVEEPVVAAPEKKAKVSAKKKVEAVTEVVEETAAPVKKAKVAAKKKAEELTENVDEPAKEVKKKVKATATKVVSEKAKSTK